LGIHGKSEAESNAEQCGKEAGGPERRDGKPSSSHRPGAGLNVADRYGCQREQDLEIDVILPGSYEKCKEERNEK
jgi:hypothetical protein